MFTLHVSAPCAASQGDGSSSIVRGGCDTAFEPPPAYSRCMPRHRGDRSMPPPLSRRRSNYRIRVPTAKSQRGMKGGLTDAAVLRLAAGVQEAVSSLHVDARRSLALESEVDALASRTCELELRVDADAAVRDELRSLARSFRAGVSEAAFSAVLARVDALEARLSETEQRLSQERGELGRAAAEAQRDAAEAKRDAAEAKRDAALARREASEAIAALTARLDELCEAHRHSASSTLSVLEEHEARICSFGAAFASLR
jgi:hypothetical protein